METIWNILLWKGYVSNPSVGPKSRRQKYSETVQQKHTSASKFAIFCFCPSFSRHWTKDETISLHAARNSKTPRSSQRFHLSGKVPVAFWCTLGGNGTDVAAQEEAALKRETVKMHRIILCVNAHIGRRREPSWWKVTPELHTISTCWTLQSVFRHYHTKLDREESSKEMA